MVDSDTKIHDPASTGQVTIPKGATLSLLCFVDPARIPLFARAGPILEFHATNRDTLKWIKAKLLNNSDNSNDSSLHEKEETECPAALLLRVEGSPPPVAARWIISDLLVYGILSTQGRRQGQSSHHHTTRVRKKELRLYAAPLSDDFITRAQSLPSPPDTPPSTRRAAANGELEEEEYEGEFIHVPQQTPESTKRRKRVVAKFFEAAVQHHRGVQRKGGEAVSQLMARAHHQHTEAEVSQSLVQIKQEPQEQQPSILPLLNKSLVDSGGQSGGGKRKARSSSHLDDTATTNKDLITRTILTCMRLYGYTRKPASKNISHYERDSTPAAYSTEDDEFKAMYHAVYRAATFALRKYLRPWPDAPLLTKEKATGLVDEILRLFCEDA